MDGGALSADIGVVVEDARGRGPKRRTWDVRVLAEVDALKATEGEEDNWENTYCIDRVACRRGEDSM